MNDARLAEAAYNAYCDARNWKSVRGDTLPAFADQDRGLQEAWEAAAKAVRKQIHIHVAAILAGEEPES